MTTLTEEKPMAAKLNCWEVMKCHHATHSPDGCPAFTGKGTATKLDGVHGGRNAGRACWVIAGTRCAGKVQGEFALKANNCMQCQFYRQVAAEERASGLKNGMVLLEMLKA